MSVYKQTQSRSQKTTAEHTRTLLCMYTPVHNTPHVYTPYTQGEHTFSHTELQGHRATGTHRATVCMCTYIHFLTHVCIPLTVSQTCMHLSNAHFCTERHKDTHTGHIAINTNSPMPSPCLNSHDEHTHSSKSLLGCERDEKPQAEANSTSPRTDRKFWKELGKRDLQTGTQPRKQEVNSSVPYVCTAAPWSWKPN